MRSPWLVAATIVALAAAGYAFYTLGGRSDRAAPDEPTRAKAERAEPPVRPNRGGVKPAAASAKGDARARGGPPPKIEASVSLPKARDEFAAVLDELDAIVKQRRRITNEQWVALYKKGHDALLPLQQHLSWSVPEQADELRTAQDELRTKLQAAQPRPDPSPP